MEKLANGWSVAPHWFPYLLIGFLLQFAIRVILSVLSAVAMTHRSQENFGINFLLSLRGYHPNGSDSDRISDYWFPFILGLIELYSFPVLMATGAWTVIGAWLGFKTVAQWKRWGDDRITFNRFLIGNALVVLSSLMVLVPYVRIT
jgi:hypothetical protein